MLFEQGTDAVRSMQTRRNWQTRQAGTEPTKSNQSVAKKYFDASHILGAEGRIRSRTIETLQMDVGDAPGQHAG